MSLVNGVKLTWPIISNDNELDILLYTGNGTALAVSLFATALKGTNTLQRGTFRLSKAFKGLRGATHENWVDTAHYIPIKLQGDISLYDADPHYCKDRS